MSSRDIVEQIFDQYHKPQDLEDTKLRKSIARAEAEDIERKLDEEWVSSTQQEVEEQVDSVFNDLALKYGEDPGGNTVDAKLLETFGPEAQSELSWAREQIKGALGELYNKDALVRNAATLYIRRPEVEVYGEGESVNEVILGYVKQQMDEGEIDFNDIDQNLMTQAVREGFEREEYESRSRNNDAVTEFMKDYIESAYESAGSELPDDFLDVALERLEVLGDFAAEKMRDSPAYDSAEEIYG